MPRRVILVVVVIASATSCNKQLAASYASTRLCTTATACLPACLPRASTEGQARLLHMGVLPVLCKPKLLSDGNAAAAFVMLC